MIEDFFTEVELQEVKKEATELKRLVNHNDTAGSEGKLKTGTGLFIDTLYSSNRGASPILKYSSKIFDIEVYDKITTFNAFFGHIWNCNFDSTLINYYADGQEYLPHIDKATLSIVITLQQGEIGGGSFSFPDYNEHITFKDNTLIIFPSCVAHKANAVKSIDGSYRISIAKFLNY